MNIEDAIRRESYRGFDLVELREGLARKTRWHITQKEAGMTRNHGFTATACEAKMKVDALLKWP
jgi:hypothetical protein